MVNYTQLYTDVLQEYNYEGQPTWENVSELFLDIVDSGRFRDMDNDEAIDMVQNPSQKVQLNICLNLMPIGYRAPKEEN
jgi:hypothetical protein